MPFNGSGTFVALAPPNFPAVPGTTILASQFNANLNDIFTSGLTDCITRDGQSPPTNNLPMASFKLTGLGNGSADTDSAALGQTLAIRGQVGTVDWNTKITNGIFEGTAASLASPSANFPPTTALGQLFIVAQGATVEQFYKTAANLYIRQKVSATWSPWEASTVGKSFTVNGDFRIWQDVTSLGNAAGTRYAADQMRNVSVGTTYAVAQTAWPVGQTLIPVPEAIWLQSTAVTSVAGASNGYHLDTIMEKVATLNGRTITVSFWMDGPVGNLPVAVVASQVFGTGGSPSATVNTYMGTISITTSWTRYSVTVALPSISGKTLGSNGDDYLAIQFWTDAGSNFNSFTNSLGQQSGTYNIFGIKVEDGSEATPFLTEDPVINLARCQRFFIRTNGSGTYGPIFWSGTTTNTVAQFAVQPYPTVMRKSPTIGTSLIGSNAFAATISATGNAEGLAVNMTANASGAGAFFSVNYTADARY